MDLSAPMDDSLDIISLQKFLKIIGINPMGLSAPWSDSLDIIALDPGKKILGMFHTPYVLLV